MGYNIGPKIGIQGEAQFRQQIKAINNEYKTLQAQTKALTAEFDKNDDQQGKLRMQTQQLEKQIDAQKRAIQEMEKALQKAERTTGANSDAVVSWRGKLYDAQATVSKLEKELQDTEDALQKMERGIEDTGDAADDAGKDVADFGDILKGNLAADAIWDGLKEGAEILLDIGKQAVESAAELRAEGAQFEQTFGDMEQAANTALQNVEKQTGISATRIKSNYSTVYAFAKTMGAESEEALDIANRAMVAAADSAAYYDKTVEEVTETIQAYIKGNYANDAALGIASTETTRNAAAMERYGKAFKELTENQKVDTLLAMVEAGNKASGAMGQAAREAGEWTNVTGELDDAWKQLMGTLGDPVLEFITPIVQDLTESLREMAEVTPGEQLAKDMDDLVGTLKEAEQAYDATMASTLATATVAERYVLELQALEQQGMETAEAHERYRSLVEQLNTIMPELNVSINEQTGLINQNTAALLGDVEAWKQAATTQAMYDKMKDKLEAYGQMQVKVAEGNHQIDNLETQRKIKLLELTEQLNSAEIDRIEYSKAVPKNSNVVIEYYKAYDKAGNLIKTFSDTLGTEQTAALKLAKEIKNTSDEINGLEQAVADAESVIAGYTADMDELTAIMAKHRGTTDENTDSAQKQAQAVAEVQAALLDLETAYQEAEKSTRAMLDSSIGLWSEIRKESDWTAKKVLQNWRDQMEAFDSYSANLKKAKEMGLSDGIIEALSDGSQQSMQILDAMVNQSEYSVGEINAAFTDLNLSKDTTADALMALDETFQQAYDDLVADAEKAGIEIVDGIAQAIKDNSYKVEDAISGSFPDETSDSVSSLPYLAQQAATLPQIKDYIGIYSQFAADYQADAESLASVLGSDKYHIWENTKAPKVANHIQIDVTQLPGESGEEFAQRVAQIILDEYERKAGGLGG